MTETQIRLRDDAPCAEPVVTIDAFAGQSNAVAVRIEPGEDARNLLPHLDRLCLVEISFPAFGDGRGYSSAQILRENGYMGELRACGDVAVDQISHMKRVGFDSFAPDKPLNQADVDAAWSRFPDVYQKQVDGRQPIWAKRHQKETV